MNRERILALVLLLSGLLLNACAPQANPANGQNLALLKGCASCHPADNQVKLAPTWLGLYGAKVELDDGTVIVADEPYLIESIKEPNAKIVSGYTNGTMPLIPLTEEEIADLVAYIKSVK